MKFCIFSRKPSCMGTVWEGTGWIAFLWKKMNYILWWASRWMQTKGEWRATSTSYIRRRSLWTLGSLLRQERSTAGSPERSSILRVCQGSEGQSCTWLDLLMVTVLCWVGGCTRWPPKVPTRQHFIVLWYIWSHFRLLPFQKIQDSERDR